MKSILDPDFKYVPSASTDLRKTFARVRKELQQQRAAEGAKLTRQVIPIKKST
jgi:hypothetical protein